MDNFNILTVVLCVSSCLSWIRQGMTTDEINTLRDRLNRRETPRACRKPETPNNVNALVARNQRLSSELAESRAIDAGFFKSYLDCVKELSVVKDLFRHTKKVNTNLRDDLETANKRNALQAESIEEFKKQVKGLEHRVADHIKEIHFLEKVRQAQAQTIKEYGEKYGYSEEARKPVPQGTEKDCPSCMGRGEVRRPYTEHEKDPCLDCEGLGRLFAVNTSLGTLWYKKSLADRQNTEKLQEQFMTNLDDDDEADKWEAADQNG